MDQRCCYFGSVKVLSKFKLNKLIPFVHLLVQQPPKSEWNYHKDRHFTRPSLHCEMYYIATPDRADVAWGRLWGSSILERGCRQATSVWQIKGYWREFLECLVRLLGRLQLTCTRQSTTTPGWFTDMDNFSLSWFTTDLRIVMASEPTVDSNECRPRVVPATHYVLPSVYSCCSCDIEDWVHHLACFLAG